MGSKVTSEKNAFTKDSFFMSLDNGLSSCIEIDEQYSLFLESFDRTQLYYLEYNEFSDQFILVAQNSLCPKNSLWLNAKVANLKIDERDHFKGFKKEIKRICDGLQEINDLPYVEAAIMTVCQKIKGLFIGFSDSNEVSCLPVATKLLSHSISQKVMPEKNLNDKKSFLHKLENEISRSKKTKSKFGLVSYYIKAEEAKDLFFMKSLKKLIYQNINFSETFLMRPNGNIIILKNYMERDELALWSYKTREAIKELYFRLQSSSEVAIGAGLSFYPEHGKSAKELVVLSNKACFESLKTESQKICVAQRSVSFEKDYEPSI